MGKRTIDNSSERKLNIKKVLTVIILLIISLVLIVWTSDTLNVPLEVWLGIEDYAPAEVSTDAYEVARAYDRADFRDKNMARMALKLALLKEDNI